MWQQAGQGHHTAPLCRAAGVCWCQDHSLAAAYCHSQGQGFTCVQLQNKTDHLPIGCQLLIQSPAQHAPAGKQATHQPQHAACPATQPHLPACR